MYSRGSGARTPGNIRPETGRVSAGSPKTRDADAAPLALIINLVLLRLAAQHLQHAGVEAVLALVLVLLQLLGDVGSPLLVQLRRLLAEVVALRLHLLQILLTLLRRLEL